MDSGQHPAIVDYARGPVAAAAGPRSAAPGGEISERHAAAFRFLTHRSYCENDLTMHMHLATIEP